MAGRIIVLSGTSSAGKSRLAQALREDMPEPFCYLATDQLTDGDFAPITKVRADTYADEFMAFYKGFNRSVAAFADAGNDVMVELIVETQEWGDDLKAVLNSYDAFFVWVYAPAAELNKREQARGDRRSGVASHFQRSKDFCTYDFEVDTSLPMAENVLAVTESWRSRSV